MPHCAHLKLEDIIIRWHQVKDHAENKSGDIIRLHDQRANACLKLDETNIAIDIRQI